MCVNKLPNSVKSVGRSVKEPSDLLRLWQRPQGRKRCLYRRPGHSTSRMFLSHLRGCGSLLIGEPHPSQEYPIVLRLITPGDVSWLSALDANPLALTLSQNFDGHPARFTTLPVSGLFVTITEQSSLAGMAGEISVASVAKGSKAPVCGTGDHGFESHRSPQVPYGLHH